MSAAGCLGSRSKVGVCSEGSDFTVKYKNLEDRFIGPGSELDFKRKIGSLFALAFIAARSRLNPKRQGGL